MVGVLIEHFAIDTCVDIIFNRLEQSFKTTKKDLKPGTFFSEMEFYTLKWDEEGHGNYYAMIGHNVYLVEEVDDWCYLFRIDGQYIQMDISDIISLEGTPMYVNGYIMYA